MWAEFAAAVAAFFATHAVPVRPPLKPWLVARLGPRGFTLSYSALSLAVLVWVIGAAGRAPHVPLWPWAPWQAWMPPLAMAAVCLILALSIGRPNPFSFGGGDAARFDPARPGIVGWTRHPLLAALALWAAAHLIVNGDLAHVILFASFTTFALAGMPLVDRRKRREIGTAWETLREEMRAAPVLHRPLSWPGLCLRLLAAATLYAGLVAAHPYLFGVAPLR
jgi:uncharacterized membrane protein